MGSEIATRNRKSLATFHRTLKSQAKSRKSLAIYGVRDAHRNRKSQDFESRFPFDSYVRDRAPFWPFLGEGFRGNIRRPHCSPGPFVLLLKNRCDFGALSPESRPKIGSKRLKNGRHGHVVSCRCCFAPRSFFSLLMFPLPLFGRFSQLSPGLSQF